MRKIIAIMLCAMLILAMPIFVSAETDSVEVVEQSEAVTENLPSEEVTVTESIVNYVKTHFEEIIVIIIMAAYSIIESRIRGKMNGSIGTLNNNAVAIANNSANAIETALAKMEALENRIQSYKEKMDSLLDEIRNSEEEKKAFKDALLKVESYLNTAKLANVELANELAELLCLANIPNSKKDVLYKRHVEFVRKLEEAEEVKYDDGTEA